MQAPSNLRHLKHMRFILMSRIWSIHTKAYIYKYIHISTYTKAFTCELQAIWGHIKKVGDLHPRNSRRLALSPSAPRTPPIYMYICIYIYTYIYIYIYIYIYVCMYICIYVYIYVYIHMCVCSIYVYIILYTYTHTHYYIITGDASLCLRPHLAHHLYILYICICIYIYTYYVYTSYIDIIHIH